MPRHQAALALALRTLLPGMAGLPEAYDPVFTDVDRDALTALHFEVLLTGAEACAYLTCKTRANIDTVSDLLQYFNLGIAFGHVAVAVQPANAHEGTDNRCAPVMSSNETSCPTHSSRLSVLP